VVVERDPQLEGARRQAFRTLPYLFERDAVMVRSG
jgi:hypothetical protein